MPRQVAILELFENFVSKTRPRATFARVELAFAHVAHALAAYMEDALLYIPGNMTTGWRRAAGNRGQRRHNTRRSVSGITFFGAL